MKVHVNNQLFQHFAIETERTLCPVCKQGYGHVCKDKEGNLFPRNTVHIERVREVGFNVIHTEMPIHRTRISAEQNLALKQYRRG